MSTHLGDALFGVRERIVYSREMLRLLLNAEKRPGRRFYLGAGYWVKTIPKEKPWFLQVGMSHSLRLGAAMGRELSLDAGYDLKYKTEAEGTLNSSVLLGIRLHDVGETVHGIRLAFGFLNGHSEFGQFYREHDRRWTMGLQFD